MYAELHRGLQLTQLLQLLALDHALRVPRTAVPQGCSLLQKAVV